MTGKEFLVVTKATAREFGKDDVGYMAAALTYYAFFSVFPLLLLAVTLSGFFLNPADAQHFIFNNLAQIAPGSISLFESVLSEALKSRASAGWLALVGFGTLAFSASGAFDALDKAINRAWSSEKTPNFLAGKLTSFVMMLVVGALLLLTVVLSAILTATRQAATYAIGSVPGEALFWQAVNAGVSLGVVFLGFTLLYRFVPRSDVGLRDVWLASLITAIGWTVAKEGFAFFIGTSFANYSAVYGTLGTVIALLTWIYISSIIVLVGAEFCAETARVRDLRIKASGQSPEGGEKKPSPWLSR